MTSFKYYIAEKLRKAFFLGLVLLVIWIINYGLWLIGETFVLFFVSLLVLIKLIAVPLRFFQTNKPEKPTSLFAALALILSVTFMFDFVVIPDLWIDRFGISTEGTAIDFQTRQTLRGKRYFITYEFKVNDTIYTEGQSVDRSLYEELARSPSVPVKYLSGHPNISYLRDTNYLRMSTWLDVLFSVGMLFVLYFDKVENGFNRIRNVV